MKIRYGEYNFSLTKSCTVETLTEVYDSVRTDNFTLTEVYDSVRTDNVTLTEVYGSVRAGNSV
jgi:hypothetical protein